MPSSRRRNVARSGGRSRGSRRARCAWMVGGRPDRAAAHVAQVDELAAGIARRVAAASRDRPAAAEARAAAGVGDDRDVVAVREELRVRERGVRRAEAADRVDGDGRGDARRFERARLRDRRRAAARAPAAAARSPARADRRGTARPSRRRAGVGDRHQRHALVMGHEGAHDRAVSGGLRRVRRSRP